MTEKIDEKEAVGCFGFGMLGGVLFIVILFLVTKDYEPDDGRTMTVKGTLLSAPDFSIHGNGQIYRVRLQLREYPNHGFSITGDDLRRTRYMMMNSYLFPGDSVFLVVPVRAFNDSSRISVPIYAMRSSNQIYLAE